MTETVKQALLRLGRLLVVGLLSTLAVQLPEIINLFELDASVKAIAIAFVISVIEALLLATGGGTVQSKTMTPDEAVKSGELGRPSILSV